MIKPAYLYASIGIPIFLYCICFNHAWAETASIKENNKGEPVIEEVKPWGAFRGWSPEVPYSQNSANPIDTENTNQDRQINEETSMGNGNDETKSTVSDQSQVEIDEDKSWGAFRNLSPRVPYGK